MNDLNPYSRLASFYRYFYITGSLPNNLCSYFWSLLFAFVTLPFVWTAVFINRFNKRIVFKTYTYGETGKYETRKYYDVDSDRVNTLYGLVFTFLAFLLGVITLGLTQKVTGINLDVLSFGFKNWIAMFYLYGIGIVTAFASVGLFFIVMALIRLIPTPPELTDEEYYVMLKKRSQKQFEKMEYKRLNPSFLTLTGRWLVAFKEKNCPLITWDYEKKPNGNTKP